ncbi:MAG: 7-cyano-7-deazaguanine synthase, partial [Armatimonadota bacterium]
MAVRIAVVHEPASDAAQRCARVAEADLLIDWYTERANVTVHAPALAGQARSLLPPLALDLLDLCTAIYISDIAVLRGEREGWPRDVELTMPARDPGFWQAHSADLSRLVYMLTRDNLRLVFYPAPELPAPDAPDPDPSPAPTGDCVCMLSGGLDSLAGAVMLQRAQRRPIYAMHRSGNPAVRSAQDAVVETLQRHWPGRNAAAVATVAPDPRGTDVLHFPAAERREPSRRARSVLFMALGTLTADVAGVPEVFMCENGPLTAGLPLSPSRTGSLSTQSTHPAALMLFNRIAAQAGLRAQVTNPFVYQTKSDLMRDILAPHLSPREIHSTVSCWAVGRAQRQCGGCVPCLMRRIGMVWAGLPEEAYMFDLLGEPEA